MLSKAPRSELNRHVTNVPAGLASEMIQERMIIVRDILTRPLILLLTLIASGKLYPSQFNYKPFSSQAFFTLSYSPFVLEAPCLLGPLFIRPYVLGAPILWPYCKLYLHPALT